MISNDEILEFQQRGAICLRQRFDHRWLSQLAEGVKANFKQPGPDSTVYTPEGEPGGFYDDYCNWKRITQYHDFVVHSPAAEIAGRLMQSSESRIYHEHVLVKEPGTQQVTPWHHDQPYYGVDGDQLCSIWLPLDPVPRQACPEFVAQSHASGKLYYPRLFKDHSNYGSGVDGFDSIPDIDTDRDNYQLLSWDLDPGDCIVFHMRTIHGAPNTVGMKNRRRGFSTRWLGDDARFAVRAWTTSPPYPEVKLSPGDPMQHESFPAIWTRHAGESAGVQA